MTAIDPATCWVPVPIRWRYVQPGDVIAGGGQLYPVVRSEALLSQWVIEVLGADHGPAAGDPDEMVSVLVPIPERDAGALTVEQLGAVVIGRRTVGGAA